MISELYVHSSLEYGSLVLSAHAAAEFFCCCTQSARVIHSSNCESSSQPVSPV